VHALVRLGGVRLDFLERLAGSRELVRLKLDLGEHRAQRRTLLARGGDERLEFVGLLTARLSPGIPHLLECVEHARLPRTDVGQTPRKTGLDWSRKDNAV